MGRIKGSKGIQTAQRILDEALPLFAQYGYAAVSMRQIADRVGVNVGALYNHFPSKQQILVSLLSDHMKGLIGFWKEHDPRSDPLDRLEAFARFHIRFNLARIDAVFISFMELRALDHDSHRQIEKMRRQYEHDLRDIIQEGMDQDVFTVGNAHVAAMSIIASLTGANTWFKPSGPLSKAEVEDYYVELTMNAVGFKEIGDVQSKHEFRVKRRGGELARNRQALRG
ncbi:MAG: TetR/AcrR family transcriptional regulator [Pseudomonadota bacterium]